MSAVRVLGIDPGLARCGWALVECERIGVNLRVVDLGTLTTDPGANIVRRLGSLKLLVRDVLALHHPTTMVIEVPSFVRSAQASAMLFGAYAAVSTLCEGRALLVHRTAAEWRRALGLASKKRGERAERKESTHALMASRYPGAEVLAPKTKELAGHAWDALGIAVSWASGGVA